MADPHTADPSRRLVPRASARSRTGGRSPRARRRAAATVVVAVVAGSVTAGCGPTVTMPDVVGMRLDDAHRTLEALGVENFDDRDVVGEEDSIWLDGNWVVVEQEPVAGTADVDTDTTIRLSVGNEDEAEVLTLIPDDSAFAEEMAAEATAHVASEEHERAEAAAQAREDAEEAAEAEAEAAAERREDARTYAAKVERSVARSSRAVMRLYVRNAAAVRAAGGGNEVAAGNALAAQEFFTTVLTQLSTHDVAAPDSLDLDDVDEQMREAMGLMVEASAELLVAIDTGAPSALARERRLREDAVSQWNDAMRRIYRAAGQEPVLLPTRR